MTGRQHLGQSTRDQPQDQLILQSGWVDSDGLKLHLGRSALTLGGLLKHLALCEELKFRAA